MPIISIFFGIVIRLYHEDHNPPHFHATYWLTVSAMKEPKRIKGLE